MKKVKDRLLILTLVVACLVLLLPAIVTADEEESSLEGTVTVLPLGTYTVTTLTPRLDTDNAAGSMLTIVKIQDSNDNPITARIESYEATLNYNGNLINALDVHHQSGFLGTETIDNAGGTTEFSGIYPSGIATAASFDMAFVTLRLTGTVNQPVTVALTLTNIRDSEGNVIDQLTPVPEVQFLRGDAKADGKVNIRDAIYIMQYLAGVRDIGHGLDKVHPVNAASVKHDGKCDVINLSDAIYIIQYVLGWRGPNIE